MGIAILFKILIVLLAYLISSIPTAYILFKIKRGDDIRKYGSGNVGGTNIIRTLGTSWGILTILADVIKGFIPVLISYLVYPSDLVLVAVVSIAAVLGHIFPVYIKFKGGKGVATTVGVGIGLFPYSVLITAIVFIAVFFFSKRVSLASIISAVMFPIVVFLNPSINSPSLTIISIAIGVFIPVMHHKNIKRLLKGEEPKFKLKKKS